MKRIFKFMQENYGWFVALLTSGGVITLNLLRFIEYLKSNLYFNYYGIDINLYQFDDKNVLYDLGLSILLFLTLFSVLYCFFQTYNKIKNKVKLNLNDLINVIIIIVYNSVFIIDNNNNISFNTFCFQFMILLIIEFAGSLLIFKSLSTNVKDKKELKEEIINYLKILPFYVILLIFSVCFVLLSSIAARNRYRVIDNHKVIVYTANDYYLTLDCEIVEKNLVIYKGTQEKINNINVYSVYKEFEKIKFK